MPQTHRNFVKTLIISGFFTTFATTINMMATKPTEDKKRGEANFTLCSIFAVFLVKSDFRTFKICANFGARKPEPAYNARESMKT